MISSFIHPDIGMASILNEYTHTKQPLKWLRMYERPMMRSRLSIRAPSGSTDGLGADRPHWLFEERGSAQPISTHFLLVCWKASSGVPNCGFHTPLDMSKVGHSDRAYGEVGELQAPTVAFPWKVWRRASVCLCTTLVDRVSVAHPLTQEPCTSWLLKGLLP